MNIEQFRELCLSLPHTDENQPWKNPRYSMLVTYSVCGKWVCLADIDQKFVNVKCDAETIAEMQSRYNGAFPAPHMNKQHWLGIWLESDIPDHVIESLIRHGHHLIVSRLPRKKREEAGII